MKVSNAGKAFVKGYEKCKLIAYPDPGTGGAPWTCGWGETGPHVKQGTIATQALADQWFEARVARIEKCIARLVKVPLTQGQVDALFSFIYNCGEQAFADSTLLQRINAHLLSLAAAQFLRWDKSGGKVMRGLTLRRQAEMKMFLSDMK